MGGGALAGGGIFRIVLVSYIAAGACLSGELLPWRMLPRGTRAGILVGVLPPTVDTAELAIGLYFKVPFVGVLAPALDGGCERITLPMTLPGLDPATEGGALLDLVDGGGTDGVFDRGGKLLAAAAAAASASR